MIRKISSYTSMAHQKKTYHALGFINIVKMANKSKLILYKLLLREADSMARPRA